MIIFSSVICSLLDMFQQGQWVVSQVALDGTDGTQPADPDSAGRVHRWVRIAHGRTRMIVFPVIRLALIRSVGLKAATASSRVDTFPMFVRSCPSRTRRMISLSWAR